MNWRRNREEGGPDPLSEPERPQITPEEAAQLGFGLLGDIDRRRVVEGPINVGALTLDPRVQVRLGGLDAEWVEQLAAILLGGGKFKDPIDVFRTSTEGPAILSDGAHRSAAHALAAQRYAERPDQYPDLKHPEMLEVARARFHYGGVEEAIAFAETSNLKHGKRLSSKEKYGVLARRILRGDDWYTLSASALSRELGVTRQTITGWLAKLADERPENEYAQAAANRSSVIGADGRTYNVETIQEEAEKREYSRPQKTANAAARSLSAALDRFERLGYDMNNEAFETVRRLIAALRDDWELG